MDFLELTIKDIQDRLSPRTNNALKRSGFKTVLHLILKIKTDIINTGSASIKGIGPGGNQELHDMFLKEGIKLHFSRRMSIYSVVMIEPDTYRRRRNVDH